MTQPVATRSAGTEIARANVIDLASRRAPSPVAYAPGVPAFDPFNPDHVRAWNALVAFSRREAFPGERA